MSTTELGSQATLTKIDKLRELNVGSIIPLPQLVVVGDQSSGKSSVLESLTGFSFPRAAGLCTRYATQISCCRDPIKSVQVSIIPRPSADDELKTKLLAFRRRFNVLDDDELAKVFHDANLAMGIRMKTEVTEAENTGIGAFSEDILKIEVSGPEEVHLTVIDVPGIFRVPTPGLTTETDITLVENMVKSYMSNTRTIILAVLPCNVDVTTQEILELAKAADPDGARTMGVLTKPDLAMENATRDTVMDLLMGKRSTLKLGYFVVKNRSADDTTSTLSQRAEAERAFFMAPPWTSAGNQCGIVALKERLRHLLTKISNQEFPHVRADIAQRLTKSQKNLDTMGLARADQGSQRIYLGRLATRFQTVSQVALNGYYAGDEIFKAEPELKLITLMMKLNERFSDLFWLWSEKHDFTSNWDEDKEPLYGGQWTNKVPFEIPLAKYPELCDIIQAENYQCPEPIAESLMGQIRNIYESSRGPELGTFGGTVLSTIFEQQSEKWVQIALSHTSCAVALVHDFIVRLLVKLCPEKQVREQLWNSLLEEKVCNAYRKAMDHTRFLLKIERGSRPITFNHYFNANLQKKRVERLYKPLKEKAVVSNESGAKHVSLNDINECIKNKDNSQQVCDDILDTLESYYKVARKRFVDVMCQQVVAYYLLDGEESPLHIFCPELIMGLDSEELKKIAGEDEESKQQRQSLEREVQSLEAALKVLRS